MDENHAYLNARISAMKSKLIPMISYQKMLLMELPEVTRYISEGEYRRDITELSRSFRGIDLIEYSLNLNLARTYQKLIDLSAGKTHDIIKLYMKRWDIENIKSILRGRLSDVNSKEIAETLIPVGELKFSYLISLTKKDYDTIKKELENKNIIPSGYASLSELESELDKNYYAEMLHVIKTHKEKELEQYILREIDMHNLKILLRLKKENAPFERIVNEIMPLGRKVTPGYIIKCKDLTFEETVSNIKKLFPTLQFRSGDSIAIIEQEVDKSLILYGEKISHLHMFSPLASLGFILRKYMEILNLRLIIRGKQLNIPPKTIERMLVV
ncbi:MAG: V-type ATPase subunit [Candidatus Methanofastidiosia archaeon]